MIVEWIDSDVLAVAVMFHRDGQPAPMDASPAMQYIHTSISDIYLILERISIAL